MLKTIGCLAATMFVLSSASPKAEIYTNNQSASSTGDQFGSKYRLIPSERWISLASRPQLGEAIDFARAHRQIYQNIKVFRSLNGWFGIAVGPFLYDTRLVDFRNRLVSSGQIPADAYFTRGGNYLEESWNPSFDQRVERTVASTAGVLSNPNNSAGSAAGQPVQPQVIVQQPSINRDEIIDAARKAARSEVEASLQQERDARAKVEAERALESEKAARGQAEAAREKAERELAEFKATKAAEVERQHAASAQDCSLFGMWCRAPAADRRKDEDKLKEPSVVSPTKAMTAQASVIQPVSVSPPTALPMVPLTQTNFVDAVQRAKSLFLSASNELQQGAARSFRKREICGALSGANADGWTGKVYKLSSNGDGKGVVTLEIGKGVYVKTWNNFMSDVRDKTLLEPGSYVFGQAMSLREGQKVRFSGSFIDDDVDCVRESSMTLAGSLKEPEFIFKFSDLSAQ